MAVVERREGSDLPSGDVGESMGEFQTRMQLKRIAERGLTETEKSRIGTSASSSVEKQAKEITSLPVKEQQKIITTGSYYTDPSGKISATPPPIQTQQIKREQEKRVGVLDTERQQTREATEFERLAVKEIERQQSLQTPAKRLDQTPSERALESSEIGRKEFIFFESSEEGEQVPLAVIEKKEKTLSIEKPTQEDGRTSTTRDDTGKAIDVPPTVSDISLFDKAKTKTSEIIDKLKTFGVGVKERFKEEGTLESAKIIGKSAGLTIVEFGKSFARGTVKLTQPQHFGEESVDQGTPLTEKLGITVFKKTGDFARSLVTTDPLKDPDVKTVGVVTGIGIASAVLPPAASYTLIGGTVAVSETQRIITAEEGTELETVGGTVGAVALLSIPAVYGRFKSPAETKVTFKPRFRSDNVLEIKGKGVAEGQPFVEQTIIKNVDVPAESFTMARQGEVTTFVSRDAQTITTTIMKDTLFEKGKVIKQTVEPTPEPTSIFEPKGKPTTELLSSATKERAFTTEYRDITQTQSKFIADEISRSRSPLRKTEGTISGELTFTATDYNIALGRNPLTKITKSEVVLDKTGAPKLEVVENIVESKPIEFVRDKTVPETQTEILYYTDEAGLIVKGIKTKPEVFETSRRFNKVIGEYTVTEKTTLDFFEGKRAELRSPETEPRVQVGIESKEVKPVDINRLIPEPTILRGTRDSKIIIAPTTTEGVPVYSPARPTTLKETVFLSTSPAPKIREGEKFIPITDQKEEQLIDLKSIQTSDQRVEQRLEQRPQQKVEQKIEQKVQQELQQSTRTEFKADTRPKLSMAQLPPQTPITSFRPLPISSEPSFGEALFDVEAGKRENVFFFEQKGLTEQEAKQFVKSKVLGTAVASFKIKPANIQAQQEYRKVEGFFSNMFTRSKVDKDRFIQPKEERISTTGEKLDITFKGIEARRKGTKKKKFWEIF